jgi:drug/metabolite transporter (DMT)-like permease
LLIIFLIRKQNFTIDKKDILLFFILGALVIPVNQFFFLYGVYFSSASHSGVFYACIPLAVFSFSVLMKNERFSLRKLLTISLSVIGIILIFCEDFIGSKQGVSNKLLGDFFLFFAVSSWALYLTLSKNMVIKYGTLKTTTITFLIGMLLSIPLFIFDINSLSFQKISFLGIIGFIHLSVLVAFAGKFIYTYSTKIITTSTLATYTNVAPIITIILSWILLKEELSYFFIIGASITILGVYLTQFFSERQMIT